MTYSLPMRRILYALACVFVLIINGAIPYISIPTLGQAIWSTGFSQSFANDSFTTIYAHNIGAPKPAAMAFGLAGAWIASLFIRLGMHAADAYALMIALWLSIAFFGAYRFARFLGVSPTLSTLSALAWGTMPMIWSHAGYSMLSTGIALLPLYFWAALNLFSIPSKVEKTSSGSGWRFAVYLLVCIVAVFMDGYSFMMFAAGSSILGIFLFLNRKSYLTNFFIHGTCLALAYALFSIYIGKSGYAGANLEFFRGWGADISFFLIPTSGTHWIADLAGWNTPRSDGIFFGDASVWTTTFCLPLLLGALIFSLLSKSNKKASFVTIAAFGFYMSLGPSFKLFSEKPAPALPSTMPSEYAIAPTGTSFLSENLPGFKNMRASYRWAALGSLGAWSLIVLGMSRSQRKTTTLYAAGTMIVITALNIPNFPKKLDSYISYRNQFFEIDRDLLTRMRKTIKPGERVFFLPWQNDFLVNYLAPKLEVFSYNIGGDKNYQDARMSWPPTLANIPMGAINESLAGNVINMLARGDVDIVVLPYFDMLWAAHRWPSPIVYKEKLTPIIH